MASHAKTLERWRRHAAYDRVGFWLEAHAYYVRRLQELVASHDQLPSSANSAALVADIDEFESFLQAHSEREERGMFRYLSQAFPSEFADKARKLTADHAGYDALRDGLKRALVSGSHAGASASSLLQARQQELLEHFQMEEEACVPLMLGLTQEQYKDYQMMAFGTSLQPHQLQAMEKFPGVGQSLRSAHRDRSASSLSVVAIQPMELVMDTKLPTTSVRVRLASGASKTVKANPQSHTVAQLHQHVAWLMSNEEQSTSAPNASFQHFELHTAFPPSRSLASEGQATLQEAGLLNVALVQEVVANNNSASSEGSFDDSNASPPSSALEAKKLSQSGLHSYGAFAVIAVLVLLLAFLWRA